MTKVIFAEYTRKKYKLSWNVRRGIRQVFLLVDREYVVLRFFMTLPSRTPSWQGHVMKLPFPRHYSIVPTY